MFECLSSYVKKGGKEEIWNVISLLVGGSPKMAEE